MSELRDELIDTAYVPPEDSLEEQVATITAAVLHVDKVGREDSFYDLGGNSMQAIRICARVEQETGLPVEPLLLLEHDRLADFVAQLRTAGASAES
ncbi:hypothetical protein Drose_14420 [Dactylosporangium roseum]|uniref:Carrier domain-containing protein n=1 Tax=Dactylosporangium roseum TaxID=47989 RepID=A0ABY5ZB99_9ACTN|nr:phosphopantetheine-binding protein [Dactylosporangium roseum]UWZ39324.1 hypothetical protein Drose_14420 [Dactylosporangium roseum]